MYCKNCGNEIDDKAAICPKCGVMTGNTSVVNTEKTNTLAIVGFVLSFLVAIAGLICSIIGRKQCKERGEKGMGLATAGMIISIVNMAFGVIYTIISIAVFGALL